MVETIIEQSQVATEESALTKRPNHVVRSSQFKYYIHDGIDVCRFQLIGELAEPDIAELQGCWRTAKTTLGKRKLILDLRGLNRIDEAGKKWLAAMAADGAEYLSATAQDENTNNRSGLKKLAAIFRNLRVPSTDSSTPAP
jgi:ABC-type transporter Mla MlaB component